MDGRPLTNPELWDSLIAKNYGRNNELKYRNQLLLLLATVVGLREIELTLAPIELFISPAGELREFVVLPETITRDGYERPVLLSNPQVMEALEQYIKWMLQSGINTQPADHYLGLDPNAPLLVNDDFKAYTVQSRGNGNLSPYGMNRALDKLIKQADLWDVGVRRISMIRTCVIESYRAGMSTTDLMVVTGFSDETIGKILAMDYAAYSPIADWFEQRKAAKQRRLESFKKRRRFMM